MNRLYTLLILLLMYVCNMIAVPAHPGSSKVQQPDGTYVTIRLYGDEWLHYQTTDDGYTIIKNPQGYYVYAMLQDGELFPTNLTAHDPEERSESELAFLNETQKHIKPVMDEDMLKTKQQLDQIQQQTLASRRAGSYDYTKFRGLIILVEFNDKKFMRPDYKTIINDMVNKENYTGYDNERYTGSVYDYFKDNSEGKFLPHFDIAGPYTINYSQYYPKGTQNAGIICKEVAIAADADVDYSQYDGDGDGRADLVFFIFAGHSSNYQKNDQRLLWPHRSVISTDVDGIKVRDYVCTTELHGLESDPVKILDGIGTICHEFGHVLGLPDFYDTDYEKGGGESDHPGLWSVMAYGCYMNKDRTPVGYSLYERYSTGFIDEPTVISQEGSYVLPPLFESKAGFRINTTTDKEFFLFENRQKSLYKWDTYLPGNGMLVHHVDQTKPHLWTLTYNKVNSDPSRNYYKVVRAKGDQSEEKDGGGILWLSTSDDTFPGTGNVTELTNVTTPANLLSWSGQDTPWVLKNIQMSTDGLITFDIESSSQTQGIMPVTHSTSNNMSIYNLYGQRVTRQHKGLLIHNGKKVLNK